MTPRTNMYTQPTRGMYLKPQSALAGSYHLQSRVEKKQLLCHCFETFTALHDHTTTISAICLTAFATCGLGFPIIIVLVGIVDLEAFDLCFCSYLWLCLSFDNRLFVEVAGKILHFGIGFLRFDNYLLRFYGDLFASWVHNSFRFSWGLGNR